MSNVAELRNHISILLNEDDPRWFDAVVVPDIPGTIRATDLFGNEFEIVVYEV